MNAFVYENPTKIRFGESILKDLPWEIRRFGSSVLFLYGCESIKKNGLYNEVITLMEESELPFVEHGGVVGNARLSHARKGVSLVKENGIDLIVAVGGGSVIDEAKAIAVGALTDDDLWDIYGKKVAITKALPIVSVLTLPATASEMNGFSVLTNEETNEKWAVGAAPLTNPRVSFLDPRYTVTLSPEQTSYAAADIISHATEGYFTTSAKELYPQDELIEGIVRSVIGATERVQADPLDIESRSSLMWSATLAWNGTVQMGIPGMGLPCHALEMPLSGIYDIAHGAGLAIITPVWMRAMADVHKDRFLRFADRCLGITCTDVESVAVALEEVYQKLGAPLKLSDLGITSIDIDRCTQDAFEAFRLRGVSGYTEELISSIYRNIL